MARAPAYSLDDKSVTVQEVAQEFSAYSPGYIRDGLREGHVTRPLLLDYLTRRSLRHLDSLKSRPRNLGKIYFSGKLGGVKGI
ncbi:MAG: hypothetical protein M3Q39_01580 [Actinomycetota bacterium]|nr:hypothetical protein [Actinomycetota bacterium]